MEVEGIAILLVAIMGFGVVEWYEVGLARMLNVQDLSCFCVQSPRSLRLFSLKRTGSKERKTYSK